MIDNLEVRESLPSDLDPIEKLYPDAFPEEDLLPVVRELLREGPDVLSLVGMAGPLLVGHVIFTPCTIRERTEKVALLAPLAVASARQRQGIGSAIVRAGLQRLEAAGTDAVYVLGDPAYYGRFGFAPDHDVAPPYRLPEEWREAWQSLSLNGGNPSLAGELSVPWPWRQKALWTS